jgi:hypothetical protein
MLAWTSAFSQTQPSGLRGRVTDPSGAVIPQSTVTATSASGQQVSTITDKQGVYELKDLAPGSYTVDVLAPGFSEYTEQGVNVAVGQVLQFDIAMEIQVQQERVEVQEQGTNVGVSPSDNASSIVIQGKDLDALSDDPDELQSELQALAGPSAGPNGGEIYIDGFTGGQIPPKSSIREIRLNQNPFSAEYDRLGYGRIEIFTKPGTNKFHGQFLADGNDSSFNALWSPVPVEQPPYHSELFSGNVSGPLTGKGSFFVNAERRNIANVSIVDATVLDSSFNPTRFTQAISAPETRTNISPRFDFQLSPSNTLSIRYQFTRDTENNQGIGQFDLYPSQAYGLNDTEHTLQVSDTQILSPNVVNETHFQYIHDSNNQSPLITPGLTTSVLGAFTNGGNQTGTIVDRQNHFELQNYTSIVHGHHFTKFGARLRVTTDSNQSQSNFNGLYTFASLAAYQASVSGAPCTPTTQNACGPSQFSLTAGQSLFHVNLVDIGIYAEDDWRIRPNMTLSYGLRYETQNQIHDHADLAPRITFSWGLGGTRKSSPKTVLRAGYGIFYDRFAYNLVLQSLRLNPNGQGQTQYVVPNPTFYPSVPTPRQLQGLSASPTYFQTSPDLRAPVTMQFGASVERQLSKKATVALTYLNSRGEHQLFIRNINAPLPGTFPENPVRANSDLYGNDNIFRYDTAGIFRQNQLIANFRLNLGAKLSLFGFYTWNDAKGNLGTPSATLAGASETGGFTSSGSASTPEFLADPFNPFADYGRSSFDTHQRGLIGGTVSLPYQFRLNPFIVVSSGTPYNLTVGEDLAGDATFNDRPGVVSSATCSSRVIQSANVVCTPLGTFNTTPAPGQGIGPYAGSGPTLFSANLRLSKTIGFGKEVSGGTGAAAGSGGRGGPRGGGLGGRGLSGGGGGGGGPFSVPTTNRRYNMTFAVSARNIFNRVNLAPPVSDVDSSQVGQSTSLAGGPYSYSGNASRRIDLQAIFSF